MSELPGRKVAKVLAIARHARRDVEPVAAGGDHVPGARHVADGAVTDAEKLAKGGGGQMRFQTCNLILGAAAAA